MISLVVCTYNRDAYVYKTLEHIALNDFPCEQYEIVLIDNNSTDNTAAECSRFHNDYPLVDYLYVKETQQGLSFARNRGFVDSKGDCIVFLDDDAFVENDYLKNLSECLQAYPNMQAFGGRIYPLYETGKEPTWMSPRLIPLVSAIDKGDEVVPFEGKSYPIGANMGFRRQCLEQIGLFNTALGRSKKNLMGGEEKDIFNRIKQASMSVLYLPNVQVHHVIPEFRTTIDFVKKMGEGIGMSEKIRCSNNHGGYLLALSKEVWKWAGSIVLACYYSLRGEFPKANAIIKFRWSVTKGLL